LGYSQFVRNEKLIVSAEPRQAGGIQAEIAVSVILVALVAVLRFDSVIDGAKKPRKRARRIRGFFSGHQPQPP
jgi:hypothetical protein